MYLSSFARKDGVEVSRPILVPRNRPCPLKCRMPVDDRDSFIAHRQRERNKHLSTTSDQARLPAEFKHINKRRKRN